MSDQYLGEIRLFPYTFAPQGWADCTGQLMPISQNAALFSLLGTNFGGNGTSNFGLPDLQGRVPVDWQQGPGLSNYALGQKGGSETVALTSTNMGAHSHAMVASTTNGNTNSPSATAVLAQPYVAATPRTGNQGQIYNAQAPTTSLTPATIQPVGGSQPHNNVQPSLVMRYCIALTGIFPPRN